MSMDVQTVVANTLTFNTNTFVHPALQGLSDADLLKRPSEQLQPHGLVTLAPDPRGRCHSLPHQRQPPGLGSWAMA
jgi:hypothetical protein